MSLSQSFPRLQGAEETIFDVFWSNDLKGQALYHYQYSLKPLELQPPVRRKPLAELPTSQHTLKLQCGHTHTVTVRNGTLDYPPCPELWDYLTPLLGSRKVPFL